VYNVMLLVVRYRVCIFFFFFFLFLVARNYNTLIHHDGIVQSLTISLKESEYGIIWEVSYYHHDSSNFAANKLANLVVNQ
jgi:hypothetical protein